jgi:hypothetical protein
VVRRLLVVLALLLAPLPASAATYYVSPTGSDSAAGSSVAPWKTFARFGRGLSNGTITAGDTVLFRPGRYAACEGRQWPGEGFPTGGGTAGNPVTVSVDTAAGAGDVEIHGGARGNLCGVPTWSQARKCTAGPYIDAICDTNADCGSGGNCTDMSGIWWTVSAPDNNSYWWGGVAAGVAYQPAVAPGGAPKIYEIVYPPPTARVTVSNTLFTPGRAQVMNYATVPAGGIGGTAAACTADKTPWLCCTGAGAGSCTNSRIYVQTETGARPDLIGDSSFGPVEFPHATMLLDNGSLSGTPLQYITFTNNNNGRRFHFRWGLSGQLLFKNAQGITLEDFTVGYTSRVAVHNQIRHFGSANASRWPWAIGGETYQITGWGGNGVNVVRDFALRRGKVSGSIGNEMVHFIGGPPTTHRDILMDTIEFADGPYAANPGESGTATTPNAYTNQVTKSWPPPGYEAWSAVFTTGHWGPIGSGGNTEGAMITTSVGQTIRNCHVHDTLLLSFFESGGGGSLIFENNLIDLARMYYADGSHYPNLLIGYCTSPTNCGSLNHQLVMGVPTRFGYEGLRGAVIRNNVFLNVYANAMRSGRFDNGEGYDITPYKPITPMQIVNNTFHVKGDHRNFGGCSGLPILWIWNGNVGSGPTITDMTSTSGEKAQIKNNIFVRDTASACNLPLLAIDAPLQGQVDVDYNNWGGQNGIWKLGSSTYTTFPSWRTAIQAYGATNESHSLYSNPVFVDPYVDVSIQATSPSFRTGVDLSSGPGLPFSTDFEGNARPPGLWSMGAYQGEATGTTYTTTTSTTSTTGATTTTTTTTTTSSTTTTTGATTTTTTTSTTTTTYAGGGVKLRGGKSRHGRIRKTAGPTSTTTTTTTTTTTASSTTTTTTSTTTTTLAGAALPDWTDDLRAYWSFQNASAFGTINGGDCTSGACDLSVAPGATLNSVSASPLPGFSIAMEPTAGAPGVQTHYLRRIGPSTQLSWRGDITLGGWLRFPSANPPGYAVHPWGNSHAHATGTRMEWWTGSVQNRFGDKGYTNSCSPSLACPQDHTGCSCYDFAATQTGGVKVNEWEFYFERWKCRAVGSGGGVGAAGRFSGTNSTGRTQIVTPAIPYTTSGAQQDFPFECQDATGVYQFQIGGEAGSDVVDFAGVFITPDAIDDESLCRICACGVAGSLCSCSGSSFSATGRKDTFCGGCSFGTLACNATEPRLYSIP